MFQFFAHDAESFSQVIFYSVYGDIGYLGYFFVFQSCDAFHKKYITTFLRKFLQSLLHFFPVYKIFFSFN